MLSRKEKKKIFDRCFDYLKPYVVEVFKELPNLEDSVYIEMVANSWFDLEQRYGKKVSVDSALKAFMRKFNSQAKMVKNMSGEEMPVPNPEEWKPQYKVNEDLTEAVMGNVKSKIDFAKKVQEHDGDVLSALIDDEDADERERFFGTAENKETLKKLQKANNLLDILKASGDVSVDSFKGADPRCMNGIVAFNVLHGVSSFQGTIYKAFRDLVDIADEFTIYPSTGETARVVFAFKNLWSESRRLTDEEMEEEDEVFTDEELEEIEKEIERFNRGEFSHD